MTPKKLKAWAADDPDRRKEGWHEEVIAELQKHADRIEARLHRFFVRMLAVVAFIGLMSAFGLVGYGILLHKQHQTTDQIQAQRYDAILENCNDTNSKNIAVNEQIDKAIAALPINKQVTAEKQTPAFRLILNASVPLTRDCYAFADARVQGKTLDHR